MCVSPVTVSIRCSDTHTSTHLCCRMHVRRLSLAKPKPNETVLVVFDCVAHIKSWKYIARVSTDVHLYTRTHPTVWAVILLPLRCRSLRAWSSRSFSRSFRWFYSLPYFIILPNDVHTQARTFCWQYIRERIRNRLHTHTDTMSHTSAFTVMYFLHRHEHLHRCTHIARRIFRKHKWMRFSLFLSFFVSPPLWV